MPTPLTEDAIEGIAKIEERINANQGGIVLCAREISSPGEITGDFLPPISNHFHHYEAGIINGGLEKVELTFQKISLSDLTLRKSGFYFDKDYEYHPELSVPVQRKLSGFLPLPFGALQFDITSLEGLADGSILFALNELPGKEFDTYRHFALSSYLSGDKRPRLDRLGLYVGTEEVEKFLKERKMENYPELFDVLKKPGLVLGRIYEYYHKQREELGKEIAVSASKLAEKLRDVQDLEGSVMAASRVLTDDGDGHFFYVWDMQNYDRVNRYFGLRGEILSGIKNITKSLENGRTLYVSTEIPLINTEVVGIPGIISFQDYSKWISSDLIHKINVQLGKFDLHLSKEMEKEKRNLNH